MRAEKAGTIRLLCGWLFVLAPAMPRFKGDSNLGLTDEPILSGICQEFESYLKNTNKKWQRAAGLVLSSFKMVCCKTLDFIGDFKQVVEAAGVEGSRVFVALRVGARTLMIVRVAFWRQRTFTHVYETFLSRPVPSAEGGGGG